MQNEAKKENNNRISWNQKMVLREGE